MADHAAVNRSVNTIRTELAFLRDSGLLNPAQFDSINRQLPYDAKQSGYADPGNYANVGAISQAAQDPNHPAHPQNPKHHEWVSQMAGKLGNAFVFGAGATAGSDLVNSFVHAI